MAKTLIESKNGGEGKDQELRTNRVIWVKIQPKSLGALALRILDWHWLLEFRFGFSKVNILWSLDSSILRIQY